MDCCKKTSYEPIGEGRITRLWRRFLEHWSSALAAIFISGLLVYMLVFALWIILLTEEPHNKLHCEAMCCTAICQSFCTNCV